jgi:hypothetical protein
MLQKNGLLDIINDAAATDPVIVAVIFDGGVCDLYLFLGSDPVWSTRGSKQPVTYLVK